MFFFLVSFFYLGKCYFGRERHFDVQYEMISLQIRGLWYLSAYADRHFWWILSWIAFAFTVDFLLFCIFFENLHILRRSIVKKTCLIRYSFDLYRLLALRGRWQHILRTYKYFQLHRIWPRLESDLENKWPFSRWIVLKLFIINFSIDIWRIIFYHFYTLQSDLFILFLPLFRNLYLLCQIFMTCQKPLLQDVGHVFYLFFVFFVVLFCLRYSHF